MDPIYVPLALRDICAQNVAKYIVDGTYQNVDRKLPFNESNMVFAIVNMKRLRLSQGQLLRTDRIINAILQPSLMHFNRFIGYASNFQLARNHNLKVFGIGILREPGNESGAEFYVGPPLKKPKKWEEPEPVDIAGLLRENLTLKTRQGLEELDLSNYYPRYRCVDFVEGWIPSLAQLLPCLTSLKVTSTNIGNKELKLICSNFPHLNTLDLSDASLFNLQGISKLSSLRNLALRDTSLDEDVMNDLYELPNLKSLMLSSATPWSSQMCLTLKSFIDSKKVLPALEEFDCSQTKIKMRDLEKIERRHRTLKRIIATGTHTNGYVSENSDLRIYTDETLPACLHSLSFYEERCFYVRIGYVVRKMAELLHQTPAELVDGDQLKRVNQRLNRMISKFGDYLDIINWIERCCYYLTREINIQHFNNGDKRILIESSLRLLEVKKSNWPCQEFNSLTWDSMERVVKIAENPQIDRIVAMAINFFLELKDGRLKSEFLFVIADKMQSKFLHSDFFKNIDKEKLFFKLDKYQNDFPAKKSMAEYIKKIFETRDK